MPRATQGERAILRRRPLRWHSEVAPVRRSVERWDAAAPWGVWPPTYDAATQTYTVRWWSTVMGADPETKEDA